ncbi:MAG: hypothetical protein NC131_21145 [Roseburia sp.]|nr:hypothetical protein [Roseburia sp.]
MDEIINLIIGESTTLDVYVIVRIVVLMMVMELFSAVCAYIGGMKK